ncbi:MAG: Transcription factor TFIIIB component B [Vezdaea aestivalis]|nr:MAG: Transcription factor TFIIIB component B [Vezdaea aestivalis]
MASFGSSTINKSGKRFAPKALPRRAPGSVQQPANSSNRASVERRSHSQTPTPFFGQLAQDDRVSSQIILVQSEANRGLTNQTGGTTDILTDNHHAEQTSGVLSSPDLLRAEGVVLVQANGEAVPNNFQRTPGVQAGTALPLASQQNSTSQDRSQPRSNVIESEHPSPKKRKLGNGSLSKSSRLRSTRPAQTEHDPVDISPPSSVPNSGPTTQEIDSSLGHAALGRHSGTRQSDTSVIASDAASTSRAKSSSTPVTTTRSRPVTRSILKTNAVVNPDDEGTPSSTMDEPRKETRKRTKPRPPGLSQFRVSRQPPDTSQHTTGPAVVEAGLDGDPVPPEQGQRRRKKRRALTPEESEPTTIATSTMKMADLCKDLRTGKKSKLADELDKIDWNEVIKKQRERKARREAGTLAQRETVDEMLHRVGQEADSQTRQGPQMRLVNGQLVVDDSSLRVDRHAVAARSQEQLDEVEESELTRRVNAGNWLKREKTEAWTDEDVQLLYLGLRMFGTDFEIIAKMFPTRNRRQVKLKFNKEEKEDILRVREALSGETTEMDLVLYSQHTGQEYADPSILEADLERTRQEYELEQQRLEEDRTEETRKRREANEKSPEPMSDQPSTAGQQKENGASATDNPQTKKGKRSKAATTSKRKKKSMHSLTAPSEAEVVGTI